MQAEERQKRIEQYLSKVEFASLDDIARQVSASISTVRRDLNTLEGLGPVRRTHGGACLLQSKSEDGNVAKNETILLPEKVAISRACAGLIQPGQTVIVDAGTTAFQVARELEREGKALHIITNSLPVANLFASIPSTEVIVSGGVIYPRLGVLVGPLAVEVFSKTHADVAIMSGAGITLEGISNSHALLIDIQRAMIEAASRVIFCFDHTKMGRRSVAQLCDLSVVDVVVTDAAAPNELVDELRGSGLEVLVAGEESAPPAAASSKSESLPKQGREGVLSVKNPKGRLAGEGTGSGELSGGMSWD